jgi:hypothetical protein
VKLESVVWSEGPRVLSPTYLHEVLLRERERLADIPCDAYTLYDRATVVCMIASALRRYSADHENELDSTRQVRVRSALQVAGRELHWLVLCGGDAHEVELLDAISTAVASAEQAASLLCSDVSGAFVAEMEQSSTMAPDQRYLGFAE